MKIRTPPAALPAMILISFAVSFFLDGVGTGFADGAGDGIRIWSRQRAVFPANKDSYMYKMRDLSHTSFALSDTETTVSVRDFRKWSQIFFIFFLSTNFLAIWEFKNRIFLMAICFVTTF